MTTKYYLTGGTCHFDFGERVKRHMQGWQRNREEKGWRKEYSFLSSVFKMNF